MTRTPNPFLTRELLSQLSYAGAGLRPASNRDCVHTRAGCSSFFSCDPGDDELGDYPPSEVAERSDSVQISFRGEVERIEDDGMNELRISDGTGKARLYPRSLDTTFDTSEIDKGDCLEGSGSAMPNDNEDTSILLLAVMPRDLEPG